MLTTNLPNAEVYYKQLLKMLKDQYIENSFELVGVARGGVWIARRLARDLGLKTYGVIDVSFHRDDFVYNGFKSLSDSDLMATKLPFDVDGAHIVLVDDVLDSGRTSRAALNEIFDYGRPARVDLAVLVDRQRRELPVKPTFKGGIIDMPSNQVLVLKLTQCQQFEFILEVNREE